MPDRSSRAPLDWLVVIVPVLAAVGLCACELTTRSLWLDEGASVSIASQHGAALWRGIAHDGGNMLVYYLALHEVMAIFGHGLIALRFMSLVANGANAALTALLALRLFSSRPVALLSGLLAGVSVGLVFWGQDARGYAWMVTAVTASFYCLVVLFEHERAAAPRRAILGYIFFTALALYIGYDAVLVVPAQLLLALMLRRRLGTVLGCLIVVVLVSVPLLVLAAERGSGQLFWVPRLSWAVLWQTLSTLVSSGLPPNFHTTAFTVIGGIFGGAVVLGAIAAAFGARTGWGRSELVAVPAVWLVASVVLAVLVYAAGEPVELARISILMMPAVALLVAWLLVGPREAPVAARLGEIVAYAPRFGGAGRTVAIGLGLAVVILGLRVAALIPSYSETPEPWKEVVALVLAHTRPNDCVAFYPLDGRQPFGYYVDTMPGDGVAAPRSVLPRQAWSALAPHVEQYAVPSTAGLDARIRGCDRLWLIASHQGLRRGPRQSEAHYLGYLTVRAELAISYPREATTAHGWAAVIDVTLFSR
jgi:hypothetical protein